MEELKTYTVQLGDLSQEANVVHAQVKWHVLSIAKNPRDSRPRTLFGYWETASNPIIANGIHCSEPLCWVWTVM